jgi:predicted Zn-dependent protease
MTEYSNPQIPEGINVSSEHPLKDFFLMLSGISIALVVAVMLLSIFAQQLVRFIPFEVEQSLTANLEQWSMGSPDTDWPDSDSPDEETAATTLTDDETALTRLDTEKQAYNTHVEAYLQQLSNHLLKNTTNPLPDPLPVKLHYIDSDIVNAFATLGGHIFITRGLLEIMPDENALAMVLAHEIAHVQHRDPIVALSRGLTIGLALMSITGNGDGALAQQLLGEVNLLVGLRFSRDAEMAADAAALESLLQHYGHVASADQLFRYLSRHQGDELVEWFSTHPLHDQRIATIEQFAADHPVAERKTTPLPDWLRPEGQGVDGQGSIDQ